tara:strand:+ start:235 stop:681 length:447 start_codon:yes stop_codon:yes gene_type:complete
MVMDVAAAAAAAVGGREDEPRMEHHQKLVFFLSVDVLTVDAERGHRFVAFWHQMNFRPSFDSERVHEKREKKKREISKNKIHRSQHNPERIETRTYQDWNSSLQMHKQSNKKPITGQCAALWAIQITTLGPRLNNVGNQTNTFIKQTI